MCGNENIRHVHTMRHPTYAGELKVGCVCAEKMEDGSTSSTLSPRRREGRLRSRAQSRQKWLGLNWKISANGNPRLRHKGAVFVLSSRADGWHASWKLTNSDDPAEPWRNVLGTFPTPDDAALAAFDARYPPRIEFH